MHARFQTSVRQPGRQTAGPAAGSCNEKWQQTRGWRVIDFFLKPFGKAFRRFINRETYQNFDNYFLSLCTLTYEAWRGYFFKWDDLTKSSWQLRRGEINRMLLSKRYTDFIMKPCLPPSIRSLSFVVTSALVLIRKKKYELARLIIDIHVCFVALHTAWL